VADADSVSLDWDTSADKRKLHCGGVLASRSDTSDKLEIVRLS